MKRTFYLLIGLSFAWVGCLTALAGANQTNATTPVRIGIYDSRAIAYAHFWSEASQKKRADLIAAAKAAKQSGDTNKFKAFDANLSNEQAKVHRQVFSTAPVDDALATIKNEIAAIQKLAGVSVLISKWDKATLKQYEKAESIDVTDKLVRSFITPTEKQLKNIEVLRKGEPLSLEKCNEMIRKGEL